jgi:hypothetical protein
LDVTSEDHSQHLSELASNLSNTQQAQNEYSSVLTITYGGGCFKFVSLALVSL